MTGFGTATETVDGCRFVIEARAVNGRYLKCHIRLPEEFQGLEQGLEEIVSRSLDRGTVTVTVRVSGSSLDSGGSLDAAVGWLASFALAAPQLNKPEYPWSHAAFASRAPRARFEQIRDVFLEGLEPF